MRPKDYATVGQVAVRRMKAGFLAPFVGNSPRGLVHPLETIILALQSSMGFRCNIPIPRLSFGVAGVLMQYGIPVHSYGMRVQWCGIPVQLYGIGVQSHGMPVQSL